ncbi:uncharacterized protein LOC132939542 [Metopolophium dirhodum]|uniref:uncharacterized protein LOC132939542 n=1 Tax=Metopolophium dirhodum TaxID=44670 RepID=UPI00298F98FA|nr:uncharacterized protein LOC132939542 [Metopolophium dirhodum]
MFKNVSTLVLYSKLYSREHRFSEYWIIYHYSIWGFFFVVFLVFECECSLPKHRCQQIRPINGRARLLLVRGVVTMAKITCFQQYVLVNGNETMTCVGGKWDSEFPICAKYDPMHIPCDFESPEERFCGWRNYIHNEIEWLADKISVLPNSNRSHVTPGSSQYFTNYYISLDTRDYGSTTIGQLLSPSLLPVATKQRCLKFSYKVTPGDSRSRPTLKVILGGIPHWQTHGGEGRAIIGLYRFNVPNKIVIEGSSCKAAIDNLIITEDNSCTQRPYDEELDSCHDNCGKISDGVGCSCDWSCHNNNNCCPDIQIKCPYIKPIDDISRLYLSTSTTITPTMMTTSEKNKTLNSSIPKNRDNNTITIGKLTLVFNSRVLVHQTSSNSTEISLTLNPTSKGLITRRSPKIVDHLNKNISTFSDTNLTDIIHQNFENSVIPLQHNQTLKTNAFSLSNYSVVPAIPTESTNLLENLKLNKIAGLSYVYDAIYVIGYLVAIGVILFLVKHSFYFIKSLIKKQTDVKDQTSVETNNEGSRNIGLISNL